MNELLKGVENRYNRAQTLQVLFNEAYTGPGQPRRTESGKLALRKPGRMRWDYAKPAGEALRIRRQVALALYPGE